MLLALPALVLVAFVSLFQCDRSGPFEHPTGSHDAILRYSVGGGLAPVPGDALDTRLVLYGDGRLVLAREEPWTEVRLTEDGVQRLLEAAVESGRIFDQPESYSSNDCADCPTTTIAVNADGDSGTVRAYALGIAQPDGDYDQDTYDALASLARFLDGVRPEMFGGDQVTATGPYLPGGAWFISFEYGGVPPSSEDTWPLGLPHLQDATHGGVLCGADADQAHAFLATRPGRPIADAGKSYLVQIRPLLPDDPGASQCGL